MNDIRRDIDKGGQDNIDTDPAMGMDTTGGSVALIGSRPKGNADVIEKVCQTCPHSNIG